MRKARWPGSRRSERPSVDPTIAAHRGRIVKTTGDGMLVEFASAVDAVRGAVEVQRGDGRAECVCAAGPNGSNSESASMSATSLLTTTIFSVTASISPRGWRVLPSRAVFACRTTPIGKSGARSRSHATTLGRKLLRILPSPCGPGGFSLAGQNAATGAVGFASGPGSGARAPRQALHRGTAVPEHER